MVKRCHCLFLFKKKYKYYVVGLRWNDGNSGNRMIVDLNVTILASRNHDSGVVETTFDWLDYP